MLGLCKKKSEGFDPELIIVGEKSQELAQERRALCWKDIPVVSLLLPEQIFAYMYGPIKLCSILTISKAQERL